MRPTASRIGGRFLVATVLVTSLATVPATAEATAEASTGSYLLTATQPTGSYAPTFTGNGYLGVRVPAAGQGYAAGTVPAQSELAGFYAQPPGQVQERANIPTWSTLTVGDAGPTTGWRQRLNLHTGTITTTMRSTAPDGHVTDLSYDVFADRARPNVAVVRLRMTPEWSGTATVTDLIDGTPATMTTGVAKGWHASSRQTWETVRTQGTGIVAGLATHLGLSSDVRPTDTPVAQGTDQSVGQRLAFPVTSGRAYTVTKYVGVTTSRADPGGAALRSADSAAGTGYGRLAAENAAAWRALWAGRIDVAGDPTLATEVNASEFYLWSSTRDGVAWSVSPAGLSSNGYDGHIFWDAETWMYPTLLAQHPDLAAGMNAYREQRLPQAESHAQATGYQGARFPWESALDGTEQIPPPASINSEGLYEQHITADVALAQWQYYLATGDRNWLRVHGWPVISQAATFWAGRATLGTDRKYHILGVTGPDEENPDVNDEAYTNTGAAVTLRIGTQAAAALAGHAPPSWTTIADGLVVPVNGVHPEFAGYQGQLVKQADVTMLQYPWARPMTKATAQSDLDYYVPRSDPGGPSMSDAVNTIDTAALGSPGCASYVYTERSIEPFIRDAFDQFSETKTGGAFTFMTGIGGFLQEFLYGYSGLRWDAGSVHLDPSLTGQLGGVTLHNLSWQGRRFTVSIGRSSTRVSLEHGPALPVTVGATTRTIKTGRSLTVPTRRPDLTATGDVVRCGAATASTSQPGADPLAAVDGSPATDWQPTTVPATLTAPLTRQATISTATVQWGQQWPPAPAPNVPPPPGPVTTLRAKDYDVLVSADGRTWKVVAQIRGRTTGTQDHLTFSPVQARFVQVHILTSAQPTPPQLNEIVVP
jgi:trehalose/maltose hydrolase-like predicted phosphorylase